MTVVIAMLRAVNVGGRNSIKMEALRSLLESLGLANPRTHIQSGNVIFGTKDKNLPKLAARLSAEIEQVFGVRSEVILRTAVELQDVITRNPFAGRSDVAPNKLVVTFLTMDPGAQAAKNIAAITGGPEELHLHGRELFAHFPNGISGSRIPPTAIDKALKTPGTARNWNTVTRLMELAADWKKE